MTLGEYRTERGLTLEQLAVELGLAPGSRGWMSEIENGRKDASLRLALRIERWSGGRVTAASVCSELRDEHPAPPSEDAATIAQVAEAGAGKNGANVPRTEGAA